MKWGKVAINILCVLCCLKRSLKPLKNIWTHVVLQSFKFSEVSSSFFGISHSPQGLWDFITSVCSNTSKALSSPAGPVFLAGGPSHSMLEWLSQEGRAVCSQFQNGVQPSDSEDCASGQQTDSFSSVSIVQCLYIFFILFPLFLWQSKKGTSCLFEWEIPDSSNWTMFGFFCLRLYLW